MYLEKITIDYQTIYAKPKILDELKNCKIYISLSNFNELKTVINDLINSQEHPIERKNRLLNKLKKLITFIKKYNQQILNTDTPQTEEFLYNTENNCYIVIVKEIGNINDAFIDDNYKYIAKEIYDTLSIAIYENAQILSLNDRITEAISENSLSIFHVNIKCTQD